MAFDQKEYSITTIRLPKEKKDELIKYTEKYNISLATLIKKALTEYTGIKF